MAIARAKTRPRFLTAEWRHLVLLNYEVDPAILSGRVPAGCELDDIAYRWRRAGIWEGLSVSFSGSPVVPVAESEASFITEHYWGYVGQRDHSTMEYQVEHPRWAIWHADAATLECDAAALYGPELAEALSAPPATAFVTEGSTVVVRRGRALDHTNGTP